MINKSIKIYRDILESNNNWADLNRQLLKKNKVAMLNLIGSPGAGKTALLEKTLVLIGKKINLAVLEGDVETIRDSERLKNLDIQVSQLLTGGACHLEASLIHQALLDLDLKSLDLVIVENVGNMVCPAEFDIGEDAKIAVLSVTEGEDKALKYPLLFREAKAVILTKIDLLPYLPYNLETALESIRQVNSQLRIFPISAYKQTGLEELCEWIEKYGATN
jgi:hydrogenase nickel incorporation protein HypB